MNCVFNYDQVTAYGLMSENALWSKVSNAKFII